LSTTGRRAAEHEPIARVLPMLSVPHLDREFDYLVSEEQSDDAQPGVRVRVRFHGRLVDAFVLERRSETDHVGQLGWLDRVISAEPVLTAEVRRLVDAVAARYAGTRPDVLRLAIPPRHAGAEKSQRSALPLPVVPPVDPAGWARYNGGAPFLEALAEGRAARAVWQTLPGDGWCDRLAEAAAAAVSGGYGVLAVVPDQRDIDALWQAATARIDASAVVALAAGLGPSARYRRWLSVLRGEARLVIGTRSAVFAPVDRLGLVMVWDDGDDSLAEPRAPYPHAREVAMLRAHQAATPGPPKRRHSSPAGGHTTWWRPAPWCAPAPPGSSRSTTTAMPKNAIRPPAPPGCRPWHCAPRAPHWNGGRRSWCRCPGADISRRWPAPGVAPSHAAGTAWARCRCRTATPRERSAGGAAGSTPPCAAGVAAPTPSARWWSAPAALPRNSAAPSPARR
jgi:hypothetical protein